MVPGAPPNPGRGAAESAWTRRAACQPGDEHRKPGRPPGPPGLPGLEKPPGVVRVGCLGRGPPGNWPARALPLRRTRREASGMGGATTGSARRPSIEDRPAALNSAGLTRGCGWSSGGWDSYGCFVDRAWACLRHHDATNRRRGYIGNARSDWCCGNCFGRRWSRCFDE